MLRAIVKQNKSSLNNFYPKFLLTDQNFDTIQTLSDLLDVNSVVMETGDCIIESVSAIGLGDVLLYGTLNATSFVILKREEGGVPQEEAQSGSFFIDNYSIIGTGTSNDPLKFTGLLNSLDFSGSEDRFNEGTSPVEIPWDSEEGVWIDGATLVSQSQDSTANEFDTNIVRVVRPENAGPLSPELILLGVINPGDDASNGFRLNSGGSLWTVAALVGDIEAVGVVGSPAN